MCKFSIFFCNFAFVFDIGLLILTKLMHTYTNIRLLKSVLMTVCFACLRAQTSQHTILEEVEVVSRHTFSDIIPMQTLGGKQLEKMNSLSVADAIRFFSGMQVKDYGGVGGIKTVNIRSMGSQHLGVYYDGIELGNAQNGQIDLGQFSLDNVESISLYNGQKSSLMQTASDYGNAGSVYIHTRQPDFAEGVKQHLRAKIKYGSSNLLQLSALYERKLSDRLNVSVNFGTLTSDGHYKFRYMRKNYDGSVAYDTTAVRQNGDVQALRLEGNLYGLFTNGGWNFKVYTYQSNRGIPGAIVNNVWRREERQVDSNTFLQGSCWKDIGNKYSFRVLGKYANYYTHYQNRDTTTMMVDNKYRQQEAYLSTTHCVKLAAWLSMSVAYDVRWSLLNSDVYTCPEPHRWSHLVSMAAAVSFRRFGAQASLLYNNTHDTGKKSNTGTSPVGTMNPVSRFTPALFMNYYLNKIKTLSVHAFIKNSFRMPTFNDLYYSEIGNSNLRPEKVTQYDLGVKYNKSFMRHWSIRTQADVYYNNVRDKIVAYPKGQQFRWTMLNLGRVHVTGLDVEAETAYSVRTFMTSLRLQYTYQKSIDVTNEHDSYYRNQIPYIPKHSGSAVFSMDWKSLSFNYSFIYTGERYSQRENITVNHLEPWYTSDVSLSYVLQSKKAEWRLTFEIGNLFAQDYDVILNYPMPQRTFAISADVKF